MGSAILYGFMIEQTIFSMPQFPAIRYWIIRYGFFSLESVSQNRWHLSSLYSVPLAFPIIPVLSSHRYWIQEKKIHFFGGHFRNSFIDELTPCLKFMANLALCIISMFFCFFKTDLYVFLRDAWTSNVNQL